MDSSNKGERGYYEAKEALSDMIEGKEVSLEFETPGRMQVDQVARIVCYVFLDGTNINVEMVRLGHSKYLTKFGAGKYVDQFRTTEKAQ